MKPVYLIIGIPGSGKDTQAEILSKELGMERLDAGTLFLNTIKSKGEYWQEIDAAFRNSLPIPSEFFFKIILKELQNSKYSSGFILSQNTKSVEEAQDFINQINKIGYDIKQVFCLNVSKNIAEDRITKRLNGQFDEKTPNAESIITRVENYSAIINSIRDFYHKKGILIDINGESAISIISEEIIKKINTKELHNIGQHGLGKNILVFISDREINNNLFLQDILHKGYKVTYMYINIGGSYGEYSQKFVNTISRYHFSNTIIVDSLGLVLFLQNLARISPSLQYLKRLIIFDPNISQKTFLRKHPIFHNLLGKELTIPLLFQKPSEEIFKSLDLLNIETSIVFTITNPDYALKVASRIRNSILVKGTEYSDFIKLLGEKFSDYN